MKKSFILYNDLASFVDDLTIEETGILFKNVLNYVNEKEVFEMNRTVNFVFKQVVMQIERDIEKYDEVRRKRSEAGAQGGRGNTKQDKANKANAFFVKQEEANKAVNGTVTETVNDTDNDNETEQPSSPKLSSYKDLDYLSTVSLFTSDKEYYFTRMPTDINAKEQIVCHANNISTIRSDLIRVEYELFPYDTNQFLGTLKSKIEGSFNLLYQELKIIKDYSGFEDRELALKNDLFHIMNGLLIEYKFKGFNEVQHVFNSFKKRAAKELKVKSKTTKITGYG